MRLTKFYVTPATACHFVEEFLQKTFSLTSFSWPTLVMLYCVIRFDFPEKFNVYHSIALNIFRDTKFL